MKKQCFMIGCLFLVWSMGLSGFAAAGDSKQLGIDLDMTYVSKYMWRGYDLYHDRGAFQPSINADLFGTGLSANIWSSIPAGSGNEDLTELDYTLTYAFRVFDDQVYAFDVFTNFIYFDYIKLNHMADCHEFGIGAAMPNLIRAGDIALVPSYYMGKIWPNSSGVDNVAGGFHVLGLSLDLPISNPITAGDTFILNFAGDITYNDGAFGADHDWSHSTVGVSTCIPFGSVTLTPFVNYQISMDESVNDENELWSGMSMTFSF